MGTSDLGGVRRIGDVDARAHDIVQRRARFHERALDDLQADLRLLVRRRRRVGIAGDDRRGPCDPDAIADADGARVAVPLLERGP